MSIPTTTERAAFQAASRLRRLREQVVGAMIDCPLGAVTAAKECDLVAADLGDEDLMITARTALELAALAGPQLGNGFRSSDLTPHIIGVAARRIDGSLDGDSVAWLIGLVVKNREASDPHDPLTWTRPRFASDLKQARSLAVRVKAAEEAYRDVRRAALRAERVLLETCGRGAA